MFYEVAEETLMDIKAFDDDKSMNSKDGSVYLNDLDMTSPDQLKKKPNSNGMMTNLFGKKNKNQNANAVSPGLPGVQELDETAFDEDERAQTGMHRYH